MVINHIYYQSKDKRDAYYYRRPNGLDEYVLILAYTPAYFHSDTSRYLLGQHQIFIYDKNQPQLMYASDQDFIHDWFHFDMTDIEREDFLKSGIPFGVPITIDDPAIMSEYIRIMAIEFNTGRKNREQILGELLSAFFLKLSDQIRDHGAPQQKKLPYSHTFLDLRSNLKSFPYQEWSLQRAADFVNMSKTWFQHNYKELFGISFSKDLINCRVDYAKRILLQNDYPIFMVADLCGYKSDIYFMRQFKEQTGFTPSEYRAQHIQTVKYPEANPK